MNNQKCNQLQVLLAFLKVCRDHTMASVYILRIIYISKSSAAGFVSEKVATHPGLLKVVMVLATTSPNLPVVSKTRLLNLSFACLIQLS